MVKNPSTDKEFIVECQFDSFCKTVVRNHARDIYRENKRRQERQVSLSSLTADEISELAIADDYATDYFHFLVSDYDVMVEDILIAEALALLPERKQDVILLSFFLDMSDAEIAREMKLDDSTIRYHKLDALKKIKKYMEEKLK